MHVGVLQRYLFDVKTLRVQSYRKLESESIIFVQGGGGILPPSAHFNIEYKFMLHAGGRR